MQTIEHKGNSIELSDEGYLSNGQDWNDEIACIIAQREGVSGKCPMTQEALDILKYMREYYERFNSFPVVLAVCRRIDQPRGCVCDQFPDPLVAWKAAGLPKPSAGVIAHIRRHPRLKSS